jgi:prepilin-type N-terminal cleavage/methylation domain-containing protein
MKDSRVPIPPAKSRGFSLGELLIVLAIISVMSALAFAALGKADGFNNATSTISTVLEQARAYAMANNTYVFVGIEETDGATASSATQTAGSGRVALQAFASLDGTLNLASANLAPIDRLQILNGVDLPASLQANTGALANRPATSSVYFFGSSSFPAASTQIVSRNFTFSKVIAFNSLGTVSIPSSTTTGFQYLEIDAQPAYGDVVTASPKNVSAIQVDATTGIVTVYRS